MFVVPGTLKGTPAVTTIWSGVLGTASVVYAGFAMEPSSSIVFGLCVVSGFLMGGVIPLFMLLLGKRMGPDAIGRAVGFSNLLMLPVIASVVILAASDFERTGGYATVLGVCSIGLLAAIGCLLMSNWSVRAR